MADATTANPVAGVPSSTDPTAAFLTQMYDLYSSITGKANPATSAAASAADPFAAQRPQYQGMLSNLLTNPGSFTADPGYEFAKQQGLEATSRANNALGIGNSGKNVLDLDKYATGYAEQGYDNRITQLLTASGATSGSPGTAGNILAQAGQGSTAGAAQGISSILQALGMAPAAIQQFLQQFGGGGAVGNLGGSDPFNLGLNTDNSGFGIDPTVAGDISGVINTPGTTVPDIVNNGGDWLTNTFGDLFGG